MEVWIFKEKHRFNDAEDVNLVVRKDSPYNRDAEFNGGMRTFQLAAKEIVNWLMSSSDKNLFIHFEIPYQIELVDCRKGDVYTSSSVHQWAAVPLDSQEKEWFEKELDEITQAISFGPNSEETMEWVKKEVGGVDEYAPYKLPTKHELKKGSKIYLIKTLVVLGAFTALTFLIKFFLN